MQFSKHLRQTFLTCALLFSSCLPLCAQGEFDGSKENDFEQTDETNQNGRQYLDCQYGQGKWISIMFSPGSSLAVGQINDGAPVFFTALLSGSRLTLTPRQPGKKLTINLSSLIVNREWYLSDGAGSAGTGECSKGQAPDSSFSDEDF